MANNATKLSETLESEWTDSIWMSVIGVIVLIAGVLLFYFMKFVEFSGALQLAGRIAGSLIAAGGGFILLWSLQRGVKARQLEKVAFLCPFCDAENHFHAAPTDDFDCEHCHRIVHFENGAPIPVQTIVCQFCRTEHRVAANVQRFVCDRCNRLLQLSPQQAHGRVQAGTTAMDSADAMLQNYDVLLVAIDKRHENDVAFKIQNLLVVNLNEARRLMGTASRQTPLVVAMDVPQRKAEAVRRQLQELGATATMRPTVARQTTAR